MKRASLMEDFEQRGEFWLPENPGDRVSGSIRYESQGSVRLALDGLLEDPQQVLKGIGNGLPLIQGQTDADQVTLLDGRRSSFHFGGVARSLYDCRLLLVGHHYADRGRIDGFEASLSFTDLAEWLEHSPFRWRQKGKRWPPIMAASHKAPADISIVVDHLSCKLVFGAWLDVESTQTSVRQESIPTVTIEPKDPWPLEQFLKRGLQLQGLLRLLTGSNVYLSRMDALVVARTQSTPPVGVSLYYGDHERSAVRRKQRRVMEMTFPARDVKRRLPGMLNQWFRLYDEYEPLLNLFFGTLYRPVTYVEPEFLGIAQALESYHRRRFGGNYIEAAKYAAIRDALYKAIPAQTPTELRGALKGRLNYGNEVSLRKRINDCMTRIGVAAAVVSSDPKSFVSRVVTTRNYLTHYDPALERASAKGQALFWISRRLEALMSILLLAQLGIPKTKIAEAIRRSRSYDFPA